MTCIQKAKAEQCQIFREMLIKTKDKTLIHNMETDAKWGFGPDGQGENRMGKILMTVRENLSTVPRPKSDTKPKNPQSSSSLLIIGNSNTRGLSQKLNKLNVDTTSFVFPGQSSAILRNKIQRFQKCKTSPRTPSHVFLHSGDIDARSNRDFQDTVDLAMTAMNAYPRAQILINGISTNVNSPPLQRRIIALNRRLQNLCESQSRLMPLHPTVYAELLAQKIKASIMGLNCV